VADISIKEDKN